MIRVLIVDDHAVVRAGLERLLSSVDDFTVIGSAEDGEQAVAAALEHRPDVVLMDLSMPNMGGIAATEAIMAAELDVRVVVLTSYSDRDQILNALDAGAVGYLLKDSEPQVLIEGIRSASRGESPLSPKAARTLLTARTERDRPELSERERQVLRCVAQGKPNKLIARELGISEKTVKTHLTRIFQQIGVTDRTQAALWARENGI